MNIISYLEWRGDISITRLPLCEADYAVIGCCSYFPYDGIVPGDFDSKPVNMWDAVTRIRELEDLEGDGRSFHYRDDNEMTQTLLTSPRFTAIDLIGFRNIIDEEKEEQFSAITMLLPGRQTVVVFRGTDRTLTGWKEDFNMFYLENVPSQDEALKYLEESASHTEGDIYICGHSKGGNLSMYSAALCSESVKERIKGIISLDGPGFSQEFVESDAFNSIKDILCNYIPQQSIVGMFLEHSERHCVIHSSGTAFWQHSIYTWEIQRGEFIREENIRKLSKNVDATMENWLRSIDKPKREKILEGIWQVVEASGVDNTEDLLTFKSTVNMLRSMGNVDDETKQIINEGAKLFFRAIKKMTSDNKAVRKENRTVRRETRKETRTEKKENRKENRTIRRETRIKKRLKSEDSSPQTV